jgi:putative component of membrane protein insertase Oxa1/YidC/SpoIIIJ protein YidD
MSIVRKSILAAIRWYQSKGGSKHFFNLECNFEPTCSEYTHQAISKFGTRKGGKLGWQRIKRCSDPDCVQIICDPVPEE